MDKYLIEILKEVNTIIIPDFGALTIVDQATGEVMFMSFMKFDDGKLVQHIAEKENWEVNEAKNLVAKYVREINSKLDKGETYDMYQFGSFTKNVEGEVEFIPTQSEKSEIKEEVAKPAAIETPSVEVPKTEKPVVEPVKELEKELEKPIEKTIVPETKVEETFQVEKSTPIIEEIKEVAPKHEPIIENVEEVIPKSKVATPKTLSVEEQLKDDLDVPPINEKKEIKKKPILEKAKQDRIKKKRGVGFYILLGLIAILLGGGTFFGLNYNKFKNYIPFLADHKAVEKTVEIEQPSELNPEENNDLNTETESEPETTEEIKEPIIETEEVVQPTIPSKPIITSNLTIDKTKSVQVIAGSFTEASNAQKMVEKLKTSGMNAEVVAVIDGLNIVSIGSFSSTAEMKANIDKIRSTGLKYWVYTK